MTSGRAGNRAQPAFEWTIGRKLAVTLGVLLIVVFAITETVVHTARKDDAVAQAADHFETLTDLLASQFAADVGGSRSASSSRAFKRLTAADNAALIGLAAYDVKARPIVLHRSGALPPTGPVSARKTTKVELSAKKTFRHVTESQVVVFAPVFGNAKRRVGTLVATWSLAGVTSGLQRALMARLAADLIVTLVVLAGLVLLISRQVGGPLRRLSRAMAELGAGGHDSEIPFAGRGGEVGALASALVTLKEHARESERALSEQIEIVRSSNEERHRRLFELSPDSIIVHLEDQIVFANDPAVRLFDAKSADQLVGRNVAEFIYADDMELEPELESPLAMGRPSENRMVRFDQTIFDAEATASETTWHGRPALAVTIRDMTERKATEGKVRKLHHRLVDAIETLSGGFTLWDTEDRLFLCNDAFRNIVPEWSPEDEPHLDFARFVDLRAGQIRDLQGPEAAEAYRTRRIDNHQRADSSMEIEAAEGRWLLITERKTREGFTVTLNTDITERKQAERQIEAAREKAESANRAKSDFLATMSHEIRTPMNGVLGMAHVLSETDLDDEQKSQVLTIRRSAETLLSILNDILDFSKLDLGKAELEKVDFDPSSVVDSVLELLSSQAIAKGLSISTFVDPMAQLPLIADTAKLRQILLNLTSNAIKFTDHGGIWINVGAADEPRDGRINIRFEVIDTGLGISEEAQGNLFQQFVQADKSINRRYGGSGLGLAICRKMVHLMGGEIGVESVPNQGSTFWFTLPFVMGDRWSPSDRPTFAGENIDVLLACPESPGRGFLERQFRAWGCDVTTTPSGAEALGILSTVSTGRPVRLAFLHDTLTDIDGWDVCREISGTENNPDTKLILMTERDGAGGAGRDDCGAHEFLSPPINARALFDLVARICGIDRSYPVYTERAGSEAGDAAADQCLRILLVEDNDVNQAVARALLAKAGHRIDIAGNGIDALMMVTRHSYDLVLMDIEMPEMGGVEATAKIRRLPGSVSKIPIIAMTANAMTGDRERYLQAGMDDYVSKPIDPKGLAGAIARQCGVIAEIKRLETEAADGGDDDRTDLETDLNSLLDDIEHLREA